jgi:hypothetical protein
MMNLQLPVLHRGTRHALVLALIIATFFSSFGLPVSVAQTTSPSIPENEHFLLYEAANGDMVCRAATPAERAELEKIIPGNLQPINHTVKEREPSTASHGAQHLKIILLATDNLNANAAAKAAFIRAAAVWENLITSPVTVYIDVDYGTTNFGAPWGQGILGSTSPAASIGINYPTLRRNLVNRANTPAKLGTFNALPVNNVPTDLGNAEQVVVSAAVARAIGFLNPTAQETDSKPRIGFNSNTSLPFDFDSSDGVVGRDFEAVATHEIGHALGFTSRSGSGSTNPGVWDLYRFRSGTTNGTFSTAQRIMTVGGPVPNSQFYFVPGINQLGLSDGGPDAVETNNADGNQSSHWRQAFLNDDVYIGIMDPRLPANTVRQVTANDVQALEMFGYFSNNAPPPPPPANDNFASAQSISGCSGTVTGNNLSATNESGEPNHSPDNVGGTHSVWYQWQAPVSSNVTFTTAGTGFDTVLAVYTGTSFGSLVSLGKGDDNTQTDKTSTVSFDTIGGTIYRIAVDGYNNFSAGGEVGPTTLNWSVTNCTAANLNLLLVQSGAAPDQSAAVDSVLMVADPFPVINSGNLINPPSDRNTRVIVFVGNLSLGGQPASAVTVNLVDSANQSLNIAAEDVRLVPNFDFRQVTFRLPNDLAPGTYRVKVIFGGQSSNTATIRVRV